MLRRGNEELSTRDWTLSLDRRALRSADSKVQAVTLVQEIFIAWNKAGWASVSILPITDWPLQLAETFLMPDAAVFDTIVLINPNWRQGLDNIVATLLGLFTVSISAILQIIKMRFSLLVRMIVETVAADSCPSPNVIHEVLSSRGAH